MDTETNGLIYKNGYGKKQIPRAVSIAWCILSSETVLCEHYHVIQPDGFEIPPDAVSIHGITAQKALRIGRPAERVFGMLSHDILAYEPRYLVTHNMEFDKQVVTAELKRFGFGPLLQGLDGICTMRSTAKLCKIPSEYHNYKWPSLEELHEYLFGETISRDQHGAIEDLRILRRCFEELTARGFYNHLWSHAGISTSSRPEKQEVLKNPRTSEALRTLRLLILVHLLVAAGIGAWMLNHSR